MREILAAHHDRSAAGLAATLLDAVKAFAAGATQEDDMTVVLVKREGPAASRGFHRNLDSLEKIFAFAAAEVDEELRPAVELALEELSPTS